jgi:hypothetical protein
MRSELRLVLARVLKGRVAPIACARAVRLWSLQSLVTCIEPWIDPCESSVTIAR